MNRCIMNCKWVYIILIRFEMLFNYLILLNIILIFFSFFDPLKSIFFFHWVLGIFDMRSVSILIIFGFILWFSMDVYDFFFWYRVRCLFNLFCNLFLLIAVFDDYSFRMVVIRNIFYAKCMVVIIWKVCPVSLNFQILYVVLIFMINRSLLFVHSLFLCRKIFI